MRKGVKNIKKSVLCIVNGLSLYSIYIPFLNFGVSTSAFIFQIAVLNTWHKQISTQLQRIEQDIQQKQNRKKM
jgi:hypothetical protein